MKRPKPTPADYIIREKLEKKDYGSDEHNDFLAAFDWATEVIEKDGKYGLRNALGEELVPPAFENFKALGRLEIKNGDRVVAQYNGKWGVLIADGKGTWMVEPDYGYIGYPNDYAQVEKDGKWGVLNLPKNEFLIPPHCDNIYQMDGFMFINGIGSYEKDGKTGLVRVDGAYTEAIFEDVVLDTEETIMVKFQGEWGYLDENSKFTIDDDKIGWFFYE